MESISHQVRERLPERVVHAKGAGAFGHFIVTQNISAICKAKVFSEDGKKTPVLARFSLIGAERGGSDLIRDGRGFTVKFYTEEGNFDLVGINFPVFPTNEPNSFPNFARSQKRNPATNLHDPNMVWDFITLHPESLHFFLYTFGDYGIPNGYGHMPGYGVHTFQVENKHGEIFFIKFHLTSESGVKAFTSAQARTIQEVDFDYNTRDLYRAIENGNFPVWTLSVQVLTLDDVKRIGFKAFDITRNLPIAEYPLMPIGKLVLNKNPLNYFAEIEQVAMSPSNLVDGILGSPDRLFQSRVIIYRGSHSYRLGVNYNKIRVNYPNQTRPLVYNRDGRPPLGDNEKGTPNYYPNAFNGPAPYKNNNKRTLIKIREERSDNFDQIRDLYASLSSDERNRLIENILSSIKPAVTFLQERAIQIFAAINPDLSRRIERGLYSNTTVYP